MSNKLRVASVDQLVPEGAVFLVNSSGNKANASAAATLTPTSGKTVYLAGLICTASGATTGLDVSVTVTGLTGGTQTYTFTFPAGALVGAYPLIIDFPINIPATGPDVAVAVTLPAGGIGNTNAAVTAFGYCV